MSIPGGGRFGSKNIPRSSAKGFQADACIFRKGTEEELDGPQNMGALIDIISPRDKETKLDQIEENRMAPRGKLHAESRPP